MDDKDNYIVNEEEQNVPVNPQEAGYSSNLENEPLAKDNKENRKEISQNKKEEDRRSPKKGNMDESEGFDPNMVPPV